MKGKAWDLSGCNHYPLDSLDKSRSACRTDGKKKWKKFCLCLSCWPTEINLSCEFLYSEFWLQMDKAEGGVIWVSILFPTLSQLEDCLFVEKVESLPLAETQAGFWAATH